MKTLYALLTGICKYHPQSVNVPPLKGCENDIKAWQTFLEKNFGTAYKLEIKTLLNEQATWQNVVEHLGDKHLGKADKDDVALFCYAGHGSRQPSAPEFLPYFPDGKDETLVLYDSRTPGGKDLADKELAVLLHQIGQKTPNLVVVLDSCHSGSATRSSELELAGKRQSPASTVPRAFDSYLFGWYARNFPGGQNITLPQSRHILLAACDRTELANELKIERGLFSYCLLNDLEKNGFNVSYAQLFGRCRNAMLKVTKNQHPQFEPLRYFNAHELFLAPGGTAKASFTASYNKEKSIWEVNCGALQGLPTEPDKQAKFAIYEKGQLRGHATALRTRLQKCEVQFDFTPSMLVQYQAELTSLPAAKIPVKLVRNGQGAVGSGAGSPSGAGGVGGSGAGSPSGVGGAGGRGAAQPATGGQGVTRTASRSAAVSPPVVATRSASATRSGGTTASTSGTPTPAGNLFKLPDYQPVHFELVEDNDLKASYTLELSPNKICLFQQLEKAGSDPNKPPVMLSPRLLRTIEGDLEDPCWKDAFDFLEHVARWEKSKALDNRSSLLARSQTPLVVTDTNAKKSYSTADKVPVEPVNPLRPNANEVVWQLAKESGGFEKKPFQVSVENTSAKRLECGVFYFANDFAVHALGNEPLDPGAKAIIFEDTFELTGDEKQSQEHFKLIASTEPLETFSLVMDGLSIGESVSYWRSKSTRGGLDLRPKAKDQAHKAATEDWFAVSLTVHLEGKTG